MLLRALSQAPFSFITLFLDHLIYSLSLNCPLERTVLLELPCIHSSFISENIWVILWRAGLPHPDLAQVWTLNSGSADQNPANQPE